MEKILKEIRENFAAARTIGIRPITALPQEYEAYTIYFDHQNGVAIEVDSKMDVIDEASNITFRTIDILVGSSNKRFLVLLCIDEKYRNEFAELCVQFVLPGKNGENRKTLMTKPYEWWDQWTHLLGNKVSSVKCYDVLGELIALEKIHQKDSAVQWAASHASSHDIETDKESFEVKSTVKKNDSSVTISSQYQLDNEKPLHLVFVRLEQSANGMSINDVAEKLVANGYDKNQLEKELADRHFPLGNRLRDRKYNVLEIRAYDVDDNFPKITKDSFKNGQFPESITKIIYTISLEGFPFSQL